MEDHKKHFRVSFGEAAAVVAMIAAFLLAVWLFWELTVPTPSRTLETRRSGSHRTAPASQVLGYPAKRLKYRPKTPHWTYAQDGADTPREQYGAPAGPRPGEFPRAVAGPGLYRRTISQMTG